VPQLRVLPELSVLHILAGGTSVLVKGIPVVATPVGAVPDLVVPGRTGWLVPTIEALGHALADAVATGRGMAAECVAAARPYGWDAIVDRILAEYRLAEAAA